MQPSAYAWLQRDFRASGNKADNESMLEDRRTMPVSIQFVVGDHVQVSDPSYSKYFGRLAVVLKTRLNGSMVTIHGPTMSRAVEFPWQILVRVMQPTQITNPEVQTKQRHQQPLYFGMTSEVAASVIFLLLMGIMLLCLP